MAGGRAPSLTRRDGALTVGDPIEVACSAFALLDGVIRPIGAGPSGPRPLRPIVRASVTAPVRWTEWRRPEMSARGGVAPRDERNPVFEPPSETPCDPVPTAESGRAARRTRLAATLGVGLMGAASLSTAVYQTISQSSTTVAMPGAVTELDTPLPWGAPAAAPVGSVTSSPTITPTVADLALRSEQQPLAQPAAPGPGAPGPGVSAPRPVADGPAGPSPVVRSGGGGGRPTSGTSTSSGAPSTSTGTGSPSSSPSQPPASSEPTTQPTTQPTRRPARRRARPRARPPARPRPAAPRRPARRRRRAPRPHRRGTGRAETLPGPGDADGPAPSRGRGRSSDLRDSGAALWSAAWGQRRGVSGAGGAGWSGARTAGGRPRPAARRGPRTAGRPSAARTAAPGRRA